MKITIFEIIKMIKDGKLKDGTKIRCSDFPATYVYKNGTLGFYGTEEFIELTLRDILENINYANYEILEEEKKIPEKLENYYDENLEEYVVETYIKGINYKEIFHSRYDEMIISKINEVIDYLKAKENKYE